MGSVLWRSRLRGILGFNIFFDNASYEGRISKGKNKFNAYKNINKYKYNDRLIYTTHY